MDLHGDPLPPGAIARMGTVRKRNGRRDYSINMRSVSFSPNSDILASGCVDGTIRLWETATGKEIRQWTSGASTVICVAFSPDGQLLASTGDKAVQLWAVPSGKGIRSLQGHAMLTLFVSFSPNGKFVASGSCDNTIRLWSVASGQEIRRLEASQDGFSTLAFSPDGRLLALGGWGPSAVHLWDIDTGRKLRVFPQTRFWTHSVAFCPDGKTLASTTGEDQQTIALWDIATGKEVRRFEDRVPLSRDEEKTRMIDSLAFSPDGKTLVSGEGDHNIYLWEVATGRQRLRLEGHEKVIASVVFSADGRLLASGSADATALVWDYHARGVDNLPALGAISAIEQEALWADMAGEDTGKAYRAMRQLWLAPRAALPLLRAHLQAVEPATKERLANLVKQLDSNTFAVRQTAAQELRKLGGAAEAALRKGLEGEPSAEVRRAANELLAGIESERLLPSAQRLGPLRAVEVLEVIGNAEARQLLAALAAGSSGAYLTEDARGAVQRLAKLPHR
jgi:sugar lactone lactonase YvrE